MEVGQPSRERHVVVADDDGPFRQALADYLADHGLSVIAAADPAELEGALGGGADLLILDSGFPGEAGFSVCRRLSNDADGPALILLGKADDEADRVLCLELGADDYLLKSCSPRELLARAKAVLRRYHAGMGERARSFDGFELSGRHLSGPDGSTLLLTRGEVRMLTIFLENPDRILSRDDILEKGRFDTGVSDRSIDVQISRFRRKLNDYGSQELIHTYRGAGYVLVGKVRFA